MKNLRIKNDIYIIIGGVFFVFDFLLMYFFIGILLNLNIFC